MTSLMDEKQRRVWQDFRFDSCKVSIDKEESLMQKYVNEVLLEAFQGDITTCAVDAIVDAANSGLLGGGGVDGAIHRAGGPAIMEECRKIRQKQGGCPTGEAVVTTAGKLPAKYVIHTVGPIWQGGNRQERQLLRNCYINSLRLGEKLGVCSIAFPNISTGVYHFPKEEAAKIALDTVSEWIENNNSFTIKEIYFVCFERDNYEIYARLLDSCQPTA